MCSTAKNGLRKPSHILKMSTCKNVFPFYTLTFVLCSALVMLDMIQTINENDLQNNIILSRYLSKLKDNYHTQWVENNSGVIQILKKEKLY